MVRHASEYPQLKSLEFSTFIETRPGDSQPTAAFMHLTVTRRQGTALSTPGLLDIDALFECYTLEPPRCAEHGCIEASHAASPRQKPCAIPAGAYKVALAFSPHFNDVTPHVLGVPGFTSIEIHWGNYPRDTRGCLLVGQTRACDFIGNSREAFRALMAKLAPACASGESVTIEYFDQPELAVADPLPGL